MEGHSLLNQGVPHSYVNFELFINLGWLILFFSIKIDIKGKLYVLKIKPINKKVSILNQLGFVHLRLLHFAYVLV